MTEYYAWRSVASFTAALVALSMLFSTVTVVQFRWMSQLKSRYQESQRQVRQLLSTCPDVATHNTVDGAIDPPTESRDRNRRQSSLQQMLNDMMTAQERILLSHCFNSTKLCVSGPKGAQGLQGDIGLPGIPGTAGTVGILGPKGDIGPHGDTGTDGDRGPKGIRGFSGKQGIQGSLGPTGDSGQQGNSGPRGIQGPTGREGAKGENGNIGPEGPVGITGTDGHKGENGDNGTSGLPGDPGQQGPPGPQGVDLQKDCMCVKEPSIDVSQPSGVSFMIGTSINFTCDSNDEPKPTVTWTTPQDSTCLGTNHTGVSFMVTSLQPSQIGRFTCTLANKYGTTSKTFLIQSNATGALDCDFEGGTDDCLWKDSTHDQGKWMIHQGPTQTASTGPMSDHTQGTNSGHYIYAKSTVGRAGDITSYESPELPPNNGSCLVFWFNMNGADVGALSVETKTCTGETVEIFRETGNHGADWHRAQVQIPAIDKDHVLSIKSERGQGVQGDIAADDIQYYPGKCRDSLKVIGPATVNVDVNVQSKLELNCAVKGTPSPNITWHKEGGCEKYATGEKLVVTQHATLGDDGTYVCTASSGPGSTLSKTFNVAINTTGSNGDEVEDKCTFDNGKFCGWKQDNKDKFDWSLQTGPTGSQDTGPDADHTSANGKYLYIETSSPRIQGEDAILRSHVMRGNQSACLSFYHYMYGSTTGHLKVLVEDLCTHNRTLLYSKTGDQGQQWGHAVVDIPKTSVPHDYNILVIADVGASYNGDTAIDDVLIKDDSCLVANMGCDFEKDLCSWKQSATDNFDWTRQTGQTSSSATGPQGDHTRPNGVGHFLYTEATGKFQGQNADLISPTLPAGTNFCLNVATSMVGSEMGSIEVRLQSEAQGSKPVTIYQRQGQHATPQWYTIRVNIPQQQSNFHIIISGVIGNNYHSDAAIDDIIVESKQC